MKKLDIIGIILISIGIFLLYVWIVNRYRPDFLSFILPLVIGIGIIVLSRIKKWNSKSDVEKIKNKKTQSSKNPPNMDEQTTTPDTKLGRQCKVCHTNIPNSVKTCPGCGDIYS